MEEIRKLCAHKMGKNDSLESGGAVYETQVVYTSCHNLCCRFLHWGYRLCYLRAAPQGILFYIPCSCISDSGGLLFMILLYVAFL